MMDTIDTASGPTTLSMHHDLWVELATIEMNIEKLDSMAAEDTGRQRRLQQRCSQLRHAMECLPE